nr:RNA polymerase sigma factor SigE [Marinactinospora thermotolerans]
MTASRAWWRDRGRGRARPYATRRRGAARVPGGTAVPEVTRCHVPVTPRWCPWAKRNPLEAPGAVRELNPASWRCRGGGFPRVDGTVPHAEHHSAETKGASVADSGPAVEFDQWEPPSWDEVVRTHSARVYRLAYRLTGNQHDAEDLTQEVFIRVFRSLANYTPGTFEGWLHRITTNLFLDMARRRARIRFEGLADTADERMQGREPSPAQAYDDRHFDADIQTALDALPPEFRAPVVLCDIEGLSYEEIAATLGVKLGTVRSRIHRGRAQLRNALEHRRRQAAERDGRGEQADAPPRDDRVAPSATQEVEGR